MMVSVYRESIPCQLYAKWPYIPIKRPHQVTPISSYLLNSLAKHLIRNLGQMLPLNEAEFSQESPGFYRIFHSIYFNYVFLSGCTNTILLVV